ncbi:MAG: UDP-N-acetylmuramoyl-tripeptide--D-alanyl-D-alanine ligase [Deltaproteobacteria bacterium]|nr:UDP-N-acetylmuramoyl-tripeptide--D-alanyl-D-alanine ligase [Deltaproteobacteria bacterium]
MKLSIKTILKATNGALLSKKEKRFFYKIRIDSRTVTDKDLFVAIIGETHNGHNFIKQALNAGAEGFIINRDHADKVMQDISLVKNPIIISVNDTTKTLGDIARFIRDKSEISVAAITGSNGKTTTREMAASVLRQKFSTHSTQKNYNNEIGLPLTLFEIAPENKWAVLELGISRPGEMTRLGQICAPNIGVILNIGNAHLEGLGSIEGVMKAKTELLGQIKSKGTAVLNGDDPMLINARKDYDGKTVVFGYLNKEKKYDITATNPEKKDKKIYFKLITPDRQTDITLPINAFFMIHNALAAASVGYIAGLSIDDIKKGLENFTPPKDRIDFITTEKKFTIINDAYNANPDSTKAAFSLLSDIKGKKFAVLGDMLELGKDSEKLHFQIGKTAAKSGISGLFATGDFSLHIKKGAINSGFNPKNIVTGTKEHIAEILNNILKAKDTVLVKGSRGNFMEQLIEKIRD